MYRKIACFRAVSIAVAGWLVLGLAAQSVAQEGQQPYQIDDTEVLTRGPIHEAFAEVVRYDPEPGIVVPKRPPEPIDEIAPEEKPEGEGYAWIGGYWGWDEDRQDFVWISGVWRVPPPGTQWVPGYWAEADAGWQWVSGYWAPLDEVEDYEVEYLPAPPGSLETGPSSPAPTDDYFWVPGCWVWDVGHYRWRAGYWALAQANWVWIPARYVWTPSGCVYVPGHWDYALVRRGLCFSPVYFHGPVHAGFRYRPSVVIYTNVLHQHLFCRLGYYHYYFGDYYADRYARIGIQPWFHFYHGRQACEPFYTYHRWYFHDRDPDWDRHVHQWYAYHHEHESARPPHTFADLLRRHGDHDRDGHHGHDRLAASLDRDHDRGELPFRLERISHQRREELSDLGERVHQFARRRSEVERGLREKVGRGPEHGPVKVTLPESAVRRSGGRLSDRHGEVVPARFDEQPRREHGGAGPVARHEGPNFGDRQDLMERLRDHARNDGIGRAGPPERSERSERPDIREQFRDGGGSSDRPDLDALRERLRDRSAGESHSPRAEPARRSAPNLPGRSDLRERFERGGFPGISSGRSFGQRSESHGRPEVRSGPSRSPQPGPTQQFRSRLPDRSRSEVLRGPSRSPQPNVSHSQRVERQPSRAPSVQHFRSPSGGSSSGGSPSAGRSSGSGGHSSAHRSGGGRSHDSGRHRGRRDD